jgi:hypothetical protein
LKLGKEIWVAAMRKFESLTEELKKYKELLVDPKDRKEFEGILFFIVFFRHFFIVTFDFCLDLWGMDENGNFREVAASRSTLGKIKKALFAQFQLSQKEENTIGDLVLTELENVEAAVKAEKEILIKEKLTEREKGKRLLFLFQKDLMPGINGMILESKDKRDTLVINGSSRTAKMVGWSFLAAMNTGMLFYILLFALSQDTHHQQAWGQSFALWLVVEVFVVSTISVLLMQVLIPSLTMKDVGIIKKKLIFNVISFYKEMATKNSHGSVPNEETEGKNKVFNSAEYLFISTRLAHLFSDLKIAKMILAFQTPWPKQTYHRITDVSKNYDQRLTAVQRSLSIVVLFFLSSLLSVPISVQDMIVQCASTATIGYTMLLHIRLYQIFPVLIIVPTVFLGVIIHFMIQSNQAKKKVEESRFMKEISAMPKAIDRNRRITQSNNTPLEAAIVKPKTDENASGLNHKRRRESLQQGINLAKRIEDVLQQAKTASKGSKSNNNDGIWSDISFSDDFLEGFHTEMSSSDEGKDVEKKQSDARHPFSNLTQRFAADFDDSNCDHFSLSDEDGDEDDELLFNLHLARDKDSLTSSSSSSSSDEKNNQKNSNENDDDDHSDDSLLNELKFQALKKIKSTTKISTPGIFDYQRLDKRRRKHSFEETARVSNERQALQRKRLDSFSNASDFPSLNVFQTTKSQFNPSRKNNSNPDLSALSATASKEFIEETADNLSSIHLAAVGHYETGTDDRQQLGNTGRRFNLPVRSNPTNAIELFSTLNQPEPREEDGNDDYDDLSSSMSLMNEPLATGFDSSDDEEEGKHEHESDHHHHHYPNHDDGSSSSDDDDDDVDAHEGERDYSDYSFQEQII